MNKINTQFRSLATITASVVIALVMFVTTAFAQQLSGTVPVAVSSNGFKIQDDSGAYAGSYIEFGATDSGSTIAGGGDGQGTVASREDFPIRNTNVDSRTQWVNTPSADIPREEFLHDGARSSLHSASWGRGNFVGTSKQLGQFVTQCAFSHYAYDDPIVFPGKPGAAHLHMFFGNTLTNGNSTYDTILNNGSSTCAGLEGNRTAYWAPAVFDDNGNVRVPSNITIYYKSHSGGGGGANLAKTAFPENLAFIGGDAGGDTRTDGMVGRVSKWDCYAGVVTGNAGQVTRNTSNTIPNCPAGYQLRNHIFMPYCLRGDADDNINNTAQMEYPAPGFWSGACPAGTTELPAIEVFIEYQPDDRTPVTNNWFVSSDVQPDGSRKPGGITAHTDWFGGWNRDLFDGIMNECISILAWCYFGTINQNEALARVVHFGSPDGTGAEAAYTGPAAVSAREVSEALCPGDEYAKTEDAAYCESTAEVFGIKASDHHSHTGHSH